jgi:hypothetical protein
VKNQYFGDINDYRKYGILRQLVGNDLQLVMCWMLTEDDSGPDGKFIAYLEQWRKYRLHDEALFDVLGKAVVEDRRVSAFESNQIISHANYVRSILGDSLDSRRAWERELKTVSRGADLVFFDPDNGLEVRSVRKGSRDSRKYVYWDELREVWDSGSSILVYQHFPRIKREDFLATLAVDFRNKLSAQQVAGIVTSNVVFVLALQPRHEDVIARRMMELEGKWSGQISLKNLNLEFSEQRRGGI